MGLWGEVYVRRGDLYLPDSLGRLTVPRSGSPPVPLPSYVPTTEAELESWAAEQADVWNRPEVRQMVADTRAGISRAVATEFPATEPLAESAVMGWCASYVQSHGFPQDSNAAADMTMAFLEAQGQAIGFHPAFLNAAELYEDWPDSPEEAAAWMHRTAANIGAQYGLPIPTDLNAKGLVTASASAAMQVAGVPGVAVATASIEALWDGNLTKAEIRRMVVATGAAVGAAVGQMFGIPAPIGGLIGSVVTDTLYVELGKVFGWTDSAADRRGKAWNEMLKARETLMNQCYGAARDAWNSYNAYWNELITELQLTLNAQSPQLGQGLRYFGTFFIGSVKDESGAWHRLPRPFGRNCESASGCLYYETYTERRGTYIRYPGANPADLHKLPLVQHSGNAMPGARMLTGGTTHINAYLALAYWGAERFVTPYHALRSYADLGGGWRGSDPISTDHEDIERLSFIQRATSADKLDMCIVPQWAEYMFASLAQVGPAVSLVTANIGQTAAAVRAEQQIEAEMALAEQTAQAQAARLLAVKAAQARRDMLRARRQRASAEARLNAGLLASGLGALAGWGASEILRRR